MVLKHLFWVYSKWQQMKARASSLNRGLSRNFCWLRNTNHVKFTEEYVMVFIFCINGIRMGIAQQEVAHNWGVECLLMAQKTRVQSQIESWKKLPKLNLMHSCSTLSIIRYVSKVKWNHPRTGLAPHRRKGVVAIENGALGHPRLRC